MATVVDVLIVGGGNAGFSAALSAAQAGAVEVLLIDKCPEDWAGGEFSFHCRCISHSARWPGRSDTSCNEC